MTGWRWESYQTVETQVPDNWHYGTTNNPPSLVRELRLPYVGRPGFVQDVGVVDPLPSLAFRTSYLWFDAERPHQDSDEGPVSARARTPGIQPADHGWTEETRVVDGVHLTALSDDNALRQRILDSARVIDGTDSYGCPPDHPFAHNPGGRPTGDLLSIGAVDSITVCRYSLSTYPSHRRAPLIASSLLTGDTARALIAAVLEAPEGLDPGRPDCTDTYGSELIVLKANDQEVLVRYSGCRHNGTDDGTTYRRLTSAVVQPLLTGIHQQTTYDNGLYDLLFAQPPVPKR
jgi:hypothetical protein